MRITLITHSDLTMVKGIPASSLVDLLVHDLFPVPALFDADVAYWDEDLVDDWIKSELNPLASHVTE